MLLWAASHQLDAIRIISLFLLNLFSSVQFSPFSYVRLCAMPWTAACQASLSITDSWILLNLMSIDLVIPSNHLILSSPSLPAFNVSYIRVFSNESVLPISSVQFSPTLCDPMNPSTPGLPVHYQLPEFTETHVHRVSDAIQPSHSLSSPSPPAPSPSQHQSLFQWFNSLHEVAKVLEFQL